LVAATRLQEAGIEVVVVEQAAQVGGRMIATQMPAKKGPASVFDSGAQFFTVREPLFAQMVDGWLAKSLVLEWSRGFATADGSYYADGHPRYRGVPDMGGVARQLARQLDLRLNQKVDAVRRDSDGWVVNLEDGQALPAGAVILTPPVPQSLALLANGNISLTNLERARLERINYEPCIALLIQLAGPARLPKPGGMWSLGEPIAWLADNYRKGVSPVPGAITVHAGTDFSVNHWEADDSIAKRLLLEAADPWLGETVLDSRVIRWRYSKPNWLHPDPFLSLSGDAPLIFAGDAFAGPRVEGAALSGLAAADFLLSR
jgi:predicted NAD/FAD-dependent oxidoreductase